MDFESVVDTRKVKTVEFLKQQPEIIDPGMRLLVQRINTLPFLYTNYSCSGHVEKSPEGKLKINSLPVLGISLVQQNGWTLRRHIGDFLLFGQLMEQRLDEINGRYYDQFNRSIVPIRKGIHGQGPYKIENGRIIYIPNDYYFSVQRLPQDIVDLGIDLLNDINEGFYNVVSCFEEKPPLWVPSSEKDYSVVGSHNFNTQAERARYLGLL